MHVDVQLLPCAPEPASLSTRSVVVFDILRATSSIVHAFANGAKEFIPVGTVEEAFQMKKAFLPETTLLGGEKDTQRIEGFDLTNSPREYAAERVKGKRVILRTTNGSQAFRLVSAGKEIMVGSFFNIGATADRCTRLGLDVLAFPSGDEGVLSLEDTVCSGMLIDRIVQKAKGPVSMTDASQAALILFKRFEANLVEAFHLSHHGNKLIRLGLADDLPYCAQVDLFPLVPVFREGVIRMDWNAE
jgi:2-phosphosulfolactate phosphatase